MHDSPVFWQMTAFHFKQETLFYEQLLKKIIVINKIIFIFDIKLLLNSVILK